MLPGARPNNCLTGEKERKKGREKGKRGSVSPLHHGMCPQLGAGLDDVNDFGQTALHMAAKRGLTDMVRWLLGAAVVAGCRDSLLELRDRVR